MSIANIICQGPTGYLLTDSGTFWPDGTVAGLLNKVLELPRYGAAVTSRGGLRARDFLPVALERFPVANVYELVVVLPDFLRLAVAEANQRWGGENGTAISIVYWCPKRQRAAGAFVSSDRQAMPDWYEPYTLLPVWETTAPGVDVMDVLGRDADLTDPASFDIERDGLAVMEAQRRGRWGYNDLIEGHHAAGAVRLTTVTADGVSSRVLHTWPDEVGRVVVP